MRRFSVVLWCIALAASFIAYNVNRQTGNLTDALPRSLDYATLQYRPSNDDDDDDNVSAWMQGLTRSLATIELAESKTEHYETFIQPSWSRLAFDLFLACHPNACEVVDKERCRELPGNFTWETFARRADNELLCFYAAVPEKEDETYPFAHSLNFLQMEPFTSILDLDFYDYFLRSDADAVLFPGLLSIPLTGDGWIGSGYYGMEITDHLLGHSVQTFLPQLGQPLRNHTQSVPPTQSTFYLHKSKLERFVSVLLLATKTLHSKAFTKEACAEIQQLPISKKLHPNEPNLCRWAFWHKGVASLYGTRVAIDYVLEDVTVTKALDATATNMGEVHHRNVNDIIQGHLLGLKWTIFRTMGKNATGLCSHPIETIRRFGLYKDRDAERLFGAMEEVYRDRTRSEDSVAHYIASIVFDYFHRKQCEKEDLRTTRP